MHSSAIRALKAGFRGQEIDNVDLVGQIGFRQRLGDPTEQIQPERPVPLKRQIEIGVLPRTAPCARSEHAGPRTFRQVCLQYTPHNAGMVVSYIQAQCRRRRCCNWSRRDVASARKSGMQTATCSATGAA